MREFILICAAGALGAGARYLVSGATHRVFGDHFPFGTLAVNVLGCLVLGLLMELTMGSEMMSAHTRSAVTIGFLGAFTTFSTFGYETFRILEKGQWSVALANVGAQLLVGLLAVGVGVALGRVFLGGA